jgi:hypothetical protein
MKDANIKDFRFNDLRHTFASRLAMNGIPLNSIRAAMGHSKIEMTLRYAHLSEESIKDAVKSLDAPNSTIIKIKDIANTRTGAARGDADVYDQLRAGS